MLEAGPVVRAFVTLFKAVLLGVALLAVALAARDAWGGGSVGFTPVTTGMLNAQCCTPDTVPLRGCYSVALYAFGQQAPTWVAKRAVMLANADSFTFYWRGFVVPEAAPRQVASVGLCPPFPAHASLDYPDSLRGRAGYLVCRNAAGGFCWSNVVPLP